MIVYIPFYCGEAFLDRALASVAAQTLPGVRVKILYQRGAEPYEGFRSRYGREGIAVIDSRSAAGIGQNWNRALDDQDPDDLFVLLHQDDELDPDYCLEMEGFLGRHPDLAMAFCDCLTIDRDGRQAPYFAEDLKALLRPRWLGRRNLIRILLLPIIPCPTVAYRRSLLQGQRFRADLRNNLDWAFWLEALLDGKRMGHWPARLYRYRRHGGNESALNARSNLKHREILTLFGETRRRTRAAYGLLFAYYAIALLDLIREFRHPGGIPGKLGLLWLPFRARP